MTDVQNAQTSPTVSAPVTSPVPSPLPAQDSSPTAHRYREAYERAAPVAQALSANDLIAINIDLPSAITSAVGALPQITNQLQTDRLERPPSAEGLPVLFKAYAPMTWTPKARDARYAANTSGWCTGSPCASSGWKNDY